MARIGRGRRGFDNGLGLDLRADFSEMLKDMDRVQRKIAPKLVPPVLNQVAERNVRGPAIRRIAAETGFTQGLITWKHDAYGKRKNQRRILQRKATSKDWTVRWRWSGKSGRAGAISLISFPGRRYLKKSKGGVKAGPIHEPKGFIEIVRRTGRPLAMKRSGRARLPVEALRVPISDQADAAFARHVKLAGPFFKRELERRLATRLKRRG